MSVLGWAYNGSKSAVVSATRCMATAMEEISTQGGTVINVASILGLFCAGRPNGRYYIE